MLKKSYKSKCYRKIKTMILSKFKEFTISDISHKKVYKILADGSTYYVKYYDFADDEKKNRILRINDRIKDLANPHLLPYSSYEISDTHPRRIEFLFDDGGENLLNLLKMLAPIQIVNYMKQSVEVMECLEAHSLFHGDIKAENIVVRNGILKLIDYDGMLDKEDFADSQKFTKEMHGKIIEITPEFSPPEILNNIKHIPTSSIAIDGYCWGLTFYQVICQKTTEQIHKEREDYCSSESKYSIFFEKVKEEIKKSEFGSAPYSRFGDIILQKIQFSPAKRGTFKELKSIFDQIIIINGKFIEMQEKAVMANNIVVHSGSEIEPIFSNLKTNTTTCVLSLGLNFLQFEDITKFCCSLEFNKTLQHLFLFSNRLGKDGAVEIAKLLTKNPWLITLDLQSNYIGDYGFEEIARAIPMEAQTGMNLYLGDNNLTTASHNTVSDLISENKPVKMLYLDRNRFDDSLWEIKNILSKNTFLEVICLAENIPRLDAKSFGSEKSECFKWTLPQISS